jgi:hypothetical protein
VADSCGDAVRHALADSVAMSHAAHPLALVHAAVSVGLRPVPILKAVFPGPFELGAAEHLSRLNHSSHLPRGTRADSVAALEAGVPLAFVGPTSLRLHAQPAAFALDTFISC